MLNYQLEFLDTTTLLDSTSNAQNYARAILDSHGRAFQRFLAWNAITCFILYDGVDLEEKISVKVKVLNIINQIMKCLSEGYVNVQFDKMGYRTRNILPVTLRNQYYLFSHKCRFEKADYDQVRGNLWAKIYWHLEGELKSLIRLNRKPIEGFATGALA